MLLKHFDCVLPSPLNVFKMVITPEMEYPMVCVSVKQPYQQNKLKLDLINMNSGASWFHSDELEDMDGSGIVASYIIDENLLVHELNGLYFTLVTFFRLDVRKYDFSILGKHLSHGRNMISATVIPRRENLNVINVTQFEKDAILVCYDSKYHR